MPARSSLSRSKTWSMQSNALLMPKNSAVKCFSASRPLLISFTACKTAAVVLVAFWKPNWDFDKKAFLDQELHDSLVQELNSLFFFLTKQVTRFFGLWSVLPVPALSLSRGIPRVWDDRCRESLFRIAVLISSSTHGRVGLEGWSTWCVNRLVLFRIQELSQFPFYSCMLPDRLSPHNSLSRVTITDKGQ